MKEIQTEKMQFSVDFNGKAVRNVKGRKSEYKAIMHKKGDTIDGKKSKDGKVFLSRHEDGFMEAIPMNKLSVYMYAEGGESQETTKPTEGKTQPKPENKMNKLTTTVSAWGVVGGLAGFAYGSATKQNKWTWAFGSAFVLALASYFLNRETEQKSGFSGATGDLKQGQPCRLSDGTWGIIKGRYCVKVLSEQKLTPSAGV
jgi:hypothetical protein